MLSSEHIVYALQQKVATALPTGTPIAAPGVLLEGDKLAEWAEVWCDAFRDDARRAAGPGELQVRLTVHLFTRGAMSTGRVFALADLVRSGCAGQVVSVVAPGSLSGQPLGLVRMKEAVVHDLTRVHAEQQRPPLQHVVVLIEGQAQSCD